jgi:mannose-6-phosphate isomerase-like protein (cupin superfamily)
MSQQNIFRPSESKEYLSSEGCHILEVLNTDTFPTFSIARARVTPGDHTQLHALDGVDEAYYILSGKGQLEIQKEIIGTVTVGDVVLIPRGQAQRIKNSGSEDLIFLCVCAPRFRAEIYENLEDD